MLALLSQGEGRECVWLIPTWSVEIEHYLVLIVLAHYTVLTNARLNVWWLTGLGRKLFVTLVGWVLFIFEEHK